METTNKPVRGKEREKSFDRKDFLTESYLSAGQWESFRQQVRMVWKTLAEGSVLEIGKGGGMYVPFLRQPAIR